MTRRARGGAISPLAMEHGDVVGRAAVAVYRFGHWIVVRCRVPVLRQALRAAYRALNVHSLTRARVHAA
jgi:hypothetical protein